MSQLLRFGANIHHVNSKPDGGAALHEAVAHKHEAVVELLLANGANPFVENSKVRRMRVQGALQSPQCGSMGSSAGRWAGSWASRHLLGKAY